MGEFVRKIGNKITQEIFLRYLKEPFDKDDVEVILQCPVEHKGMMFITMIWGMREASKILDHLTDYQLNLVELLEAHLRGEEIESDEDLL